MYNETPFFNKSGVVEDRRDLVGRDEYIKKVRRQIRNRMRTAPYYQDCMAFFGPAGSGKSSFVKCFFSDEQKREFYFKTGFKGGGEIHDIYREVILPKSISASELDGLLAENIRDALEYVREIDGERYDLISENLRSVEKPTLASLGNDLDMIREKAKCHITLICDDFHRIARSPENFDECYEHLRSLINSRKLSMILITDEDFSRLIPRSGQTSGSRFVDLFNNIVTINGLSFEHGTRELVERRLDVFYSDSEYDEDEVPVVSLDDDMKLIHRLSGGLPALVPMTADYFFQQRLLGRPLPDEQKIMNTLLKNRDIADLFGRWCESLDENQRFVLSYFANHGNTDWPKEESRKIAWDDVIKRGLIVRPNEEMDEKEFVTPLFREYVRLGMWQSAGGLLVPKADNSAEAAPIYNITNIYNNNLTVNNSYYETIIEQLTQINSEIGSSELVALLQSGSSDELARRLDEVVSERLELLQFNQDNPENDEAQEAVISQIGDKILGNPSEPERKKMEELFEAIRPAEFEHISEVFSTLTPKCQYYLKAAAVVEDRLKDIRFSDYSHFGFLYCKALEQNLKDVFFDFFRAGTTVLSKHSVKGSNSNSTFGNCSNDSVTTIGSYVRTIQDCKKYLVDFCVKHQMSKEMKQSMERAEWENWWKKLGSRLDDANRLRNNVDHASKRGLPLKKDQVEKLKKILLGNENDEGILMQTEIGNRLYAVIKEK